MTKKPIIGRTMGDAAGSGPEIIVESLQHKALYERSHPVVIGDPKILERAAELLNISIKINRQGDSTDFTTKYGEIACYDLDILESDLVFGQISPEAGHAAFEYLRTAIELANEEKIDAICTAPLNKEALHKSGHFYPGHTEILAELTDTKDFSIMLSSPKLKVIHVTTHVGIIDAINMINPERVYNVICLAYDTLVKSGIDHPKIGVCGINPHAGENGLFGYGEEEEKIVPAVERAIKMGIDVEGTLPADTLFFRVLSGRCDLLVFMFLYICHS